jgi:putative transposase
MKGDIFHLLNRGVEKRKIFLSDKDYLRFIYNLYDFNDIDNVTLPYYKRRKKHWSDVARPTNEERKELVDVLYWCLMPNHLHILAHEKIDGGISIFSKKIIGGYTKYFNEKNERTGVLFQGRSKIIKVTRDAHFFYLPFYIAANPVDFIEPKWRERGIRDLNKVIEFLESYRYSSFPDLTGKENFPFIINKELFYKLFDTNEKDFRKSFIAWLRDYEPSSGKGLFKKHEL